MTEQTSSPLRTAALDDETDYLRCVFPPDYRNPAPEPRYNLIVIGAGPAGLVSAMAAATLGARVALVERHAMGGDCLNVGCVPSKALLAAADAGLPFAAALERVRQVRARIAQHDSVARFAAAGVHVFLGDARFESAHRVRVGDIVLNTRKSLIATGARAALPAIAGLVDIGPLTHETVFDLREPPRHLAIVGAGAVGCELAQAFARLGTRVTLLETANRILPREESEAAAVLAGALTRDGVQLHTGVNIVSATARGATKVLELADGRAVEADAVLVAAGRRCNTDTLSLDRAGVKLDTRGAVVVNRHLRTSHRDIYAAGDVCTNQPFTHTADTHARIVVRNALFHGRARADRLIIPRCLYTRPELAHVGAGSEALRRAGYAFERIRIPWSELDRAQTDGATEGYAEVRVVPRSGRILGATLVGRDAGEQLGVLVLMMQRECGLDTLGSILLPYPTRSEYLRRLGDAWARRRLTPRVATMLRWWLGRGR